MCVLAVQPIVRRRAPDCAHAAVAPSIAALAANLFVLACAAAIYCNRKTRRLLSRQSLIMLLSVQLVGVLYDVAYMCVAACISGAPGADLRTQRGGAIDRSD
jgi:hypothetical protein